MGKRHHGDIDNHNQGDDQVEVDSVSNDLFHCATSSSQPDEKWESEPANTQITHNCPQVLCTKTPSASLTFTSTPVLQAQVLQLIGLWDGELFPTGPGDVMEKFSIVLDNLGPVELNMSSNIKFDFVNNVFKIMPDLSFDMSPEGSHRVFFTNKQNRTKLCIIGASFQELPLGISSTRNLFSASTLSSMNINPRANYSP